MSSGYGPTSKPRFTSSLNRTFWAMKESHLKDDQKSVLENLIKMKEILRTERQQMTIEKYEVFSDLEYFVDKVVWYPGDPQSMERLELLVDAEIIKRKFTKGE